MPKVFGTLIMGSMGLHITQFSHYLLRLWLLQSLLFLMDTCTFLSHTHRKKVENERQGMREKMWMKEKNQIKEKNQYTSGA
jgi:hypothetical protein